MIETRITGSFKNTSNFLTKAIKMDPMSILQKYGELGVQELSIATPVDSGLTASSWSYEILEEGQSITLVFNNSNLTKYNIPVVVLIQYGHATGNGGYIPPYDFINPALKPIFDKISSEVFKEAGV